MYRNVRLGVLLVFLGACSGEVDNVDEGLGAQVEAPLDADACATATPDVVLRYGRQEIYGTQSPSSYDNPGCDEGWVVDYEATVNGVFYGYWPETPRPGSSDGIRVTFPILPLKWGQSCEGAAEAAVYLYEKSTDGLWLRKELRHFGGQTAVGGVGYACRFAAQTFQSVQQGSPAAPHSYRVAATVNVTDPSPFAGPSYPDGKGYGPIFQEACDALFPCP